MKQFTTYSEKETKDLAKKLAKKLTGVIALIGELGSGKTTFAQGFAAGLGIKEKIISPTFVLIRQHRIPKTEKTLYHIDLYRLEDFTELGLKDLMEDPNNIVLIEWAEKIKDQLPQNTTYIKFKTLSETKREIKISTSKINNILL